MSPCLFLILWRISNPATNSRVATAIGTTVATISVLFLFFFFGSHVEGPLSHKFTLLSILTFGQHYPD